VDDVDHAGSGASKARKPASSTRNNLALRVGSAVVLAPLALFVAYVGGVPFALFWGAAAVAVLWEWIALVSGTVWVIAGIGYASTMLAAPVMLRADATFGFPAIVLLFAVVWTTDITGYFAGRGIGGPKLAPAISPNKTWAGAIAGALGAVVAAALVARWFGIAAVPVAGVAFVLSVVAQLGDLLESSVKRYFGVKDASHLIPGHGGVMDRLDGFWAAAVLAAAIGISRGGIDAGARGLLVW
jgi:phosphatidate cytidylyltransferase